MWHQERTDNKRDKKMKGLAITILLAILEISAMAAGGGDLLINGPETVSAIRREEAGVQSEVLVDAERPDLAVFEPAAHAADII
jgi:hypothetical protein